MKIQLTVALAGAVFLNAFPDNSSATEVPACVHKKNRVLRIKERCNKSESSITLNTGNIIGPQGPKGDIGPQGIQGPKGDIGPQGPSGTLVNFEALQQQVSRLQEDVNALKGLPNSCSDKAPKAQPAAIRYAKLKTSTPLAGYENGGVIGWIDAFNADANEGYVLVRALRIIGIKTDGQGHTIERKIITEKLFFGDPVNPSEPVQGYALKLPDDESGWGAMWRNWYPGDGAVFQMINYPMENGQTRSVVKIPTSEKLGYYFHLWNTDWPRPKVEPDFSYAVEAEVLPQGSGMIRIGFDFWTAIDGGTNNLNGNWDGEAAYSNWICSKTISSTNNWITISIGAQSEP
jgi:hypothetical protein